MSNVAISFVITEAILNKEFPAIIVYSANGAEISGWSSIEEALEVASTHAHSKFTIDTATGIIYWKGHKMADAKGVIDAYRVSNANKAHNDAIYVLVNQFEKNPETFAPGTTAQSIWDTWINYTPAPGWFILTRSLAFSEEERLANPTLTTIPQ